MSVDTDSNYFVRLYDDRIGEPITTDEAYGYWLFVVGVVLAVGGLVGFLLGPPSSTLREFGFAVAAVGLVLMVAGPVVRLPLRRPATMLVALGGALCLAAVAWFFTVYPQDWLTAGGTSHDVITVYGVGMAVVALGGVVVPLLTGPKEERERLVAESRELAADRDRLREERDELQSELDGLRGENDELQSELDGLRGENDELQSELDELREDHDGSRAQAEDLRAEREELRAELDRREERIEELEAEAGERDEAGEKLEADLTTVREELTALRESRARFELYRDASDEHRWRLRHENGVILATGGRSHTAKRRVKQRIAGVRRHALGAGVLTIAPEEPEPAAMAEDTEPVEVPSRAEFEVYEDRGGEYRWRLVHENGNVIADSGEGYTSRRDARRGLDSARAAIEEGMYLTADPTAFEIFRDRAGEYRWRLVHRNGNVLADGGQGYTRRTKARDGIESVRANVDGDRAEFEVYEDAAGEYRWRLVHENGNVIADSGEGYESRGGAEEAVERVREYAPDANALDIGRAAFEVFEDKAGKWRWRLRHRNGNVLADGGQGYASRTKAREGVDGVKRNAPGADVADQDDGGSDTEWIDPEGEDDA